MQRKRNRARHVPRREAGQHLQWAVTHSPLPPHLEEEAVCTIAIDSLLILNSLTAGAKPLAFDVQVSLARSFEVPVTGCHETFGCLCFDREVSS